MVTSLVMKDCCITPERETVELTGQLISLPQGTYEVCLISSGVEKARTVLDESGGFSLNVPREVMDASASLQLDVVQKGRHIGTFLMKRAPGTSGHYASALEIADELEAFNFKALDERLSERPGLQSTGQKIIAQMFSTKKDWPALSNTINTFRGDLFWYDREAFDAWFPVLAKFSLRAAANAPESKTVSNALDLIGMPLEKEEDDRVVKELCALWLQEAGGADLSPRWRQALGVATVMTKRIPGMDISAFLVGMLDSLDGIEAPSVSDTLVKMIAGKLGEGAVEPLFLYAQRTRREIQDAAWRARRALDSDDTASALEGMKGIDIDTFDVHSMTEALFGMMDRHMRELGPDEMALCLKEAFGIASGLSGEDERKALSEAARLLKHILERGLTDAALEMIAAMGQGGGADVLLSGELAAAVLESGQSELIDEYDKALRGMHVPSASIQGLSDETWAERADPMHLKRLSGFMEALGAPGAMPAFRGVLVQLVANIVISGAFIPDDKLFQRRVSAFLNSETPKREFLLSFLLLRRLPVYFNDVGASGVVRDLTTDIDAWGNDPVVYFLRKQVHVNASSNNIRLVEAVIRAWAAGDNAPLAGMVPDDVLENLQPGMLASYSQAMVPLLEALGVREENGTLHLKKLVQLGSKEIEKHCSLLDLKDEYHAKVRLLLLIYVEVVHKYATVFGAEKAQATDELLAELEGFRSVVLSSERTEPSESLYFKRHIAFGIPSVIGTYHEKKFDALGSALRALERARVLFEGLAASLEGGKESIGPRELPGYMDNLWNVRRLLAFFGLENARVDEALKILRNEGIYLSQAVDLLRICQRELTWWVEWFYRTFHGPLVEMLERFSRDELPETLRRLGEGVGKFTDRAADTLIRDIISSVTGLDELDRFLNALIRSLSLRIEKKGDSLLGITRKPQRPFYRIGDIARKDVPRLAPLLGGKAANLMVLATHGFDIPEGMVFPSIGMTNPDTFVDGRGFDASLETSVREIEGRTGLAFGGGERPLFLSVRSGSYISMPGILETVLYVGMNEHTRAALSRESGNPWFSWDAYRRFVEDYATVVLGLPEEEFEAIEREFLHENNSKHPRDLTAWQVSLLVHEYLGHIHQKRLAIPDDPLEQLRETVRAIYRSWHLQRALDFRSAMGVSGHWGTGVVVMEMVYANTPGAGASVFFTRDPITLDPVPFGETRRMSTGDDLVGGGEYSRPISRAQTDRWETLEERGPELYRRHAELARRVEEAMGVPQEIEAAYVRQRMIVLQTKRMEFRRGRAEQFDAVCRMESSIVGRGIGVYGGALSGAVTFAATVDEVRALREVLGDVPLILVRRETSTDDVALLPEVEGLLTVIGGAASHAAILAQKFGITAVVGSPDVELARDEEGIPFAHIGGYQAYEGMPLSIDGSTGVIYSGVCEFTVKEGW